MYRPKGHPRTKYTVYGSTRWQPRSPAPGLPLLSNNTNNSISISWSNPEVKLEAVNHDDSGLPTYEQAMSQIWQIDHLVFDEINFQK